LRKFLPSCVSLPRNWSRVRLLFRFPLLGSPLLSLFLWPVGSIPLGILFFFLFGVHHSFWSKFVGSWALSSLGLPFPLFCFRRCRILVRSSLCCLLLQKKRRFDPPVSGRLVVSGRDRVGTFSGLPSLAAIASALGPVGALPPWSVVRLPVLFSPSLLLFGVAPSAISRTSICISIPPLPLVRVKRFGEFQLGSAIALAAALLFRRRVLCRYLLVCSATPVCVVLFWCAPLEA
jgi:hypothetical protein